MTYQWAHNYWIDLCNRWSTRDIKWEQLGFALEGAVATYSGLYNGKLCRVVQHNFNPTELRRQQIEVRMENAYLTLEYIAAGKLPSA